MVTQIHQVDSRFVVAWRTVIERSRQSWEFGYAIALVFVLTQGPVYKIWRNSEQYTAVPITPTWQATFIAVQIPALMLLARRGLNQRFLRGPFILLCALMVWMATSSVWATLSRHSFVEALSFSVTTSAGLYLGSRLTSKQFVHVSFIAMQAGVVLSYFAIKSDWSESLDPEGNWTGIYFNRNSLGPVASVGLITGLIVMFFVSRSRQNRGRIEGCSIVALLCVLDVVVLVRSGSRTSIAAIGAGVAAYGFWVTVRSFARSRQISLKTVVQFVYPAFVGIVLVLAWVGFRFQQVIISWFGKAEYFNGRSALWHFSWTGFLDRPYLGWGWRVAWSTPEFLKRDLWWTTTGATWSHNAYLEVLLGGGIVAGLLFAFYVLWSGQRVIENIYNSAAEAWRVGVAVFFLVACTQEVFVIGNHFLWLTFVAALTPPTSRSAQLQVASDHQT